jgi:hypothetical protein
MKNHPTFARLLLVCAALTVSVSSLAAATPVLLGLWRFDEPDGDIATDASGLRHDGTLRGDNGNVPTRVPGQAGFGGALQFVNNGIDHVYVDIPASPLLKIGLTADDTWTITLWANEASDGTGNYIATYGRFIVQDGGLGMEWDSGAPAPADPQVYVWHNSLAAWRQSFGPFDNVSSLLDRWIHWALVYDGQSLILYRDGNQGLLAWKQSIALQASLNFGGYAGALQIGTQLNMSADRNWHGLLDDVAVFRGALAETEIRAVMTGDFSPYLGGGAPRIVSQPEDQIVNQRLDATFSVSATSDTEMSYQWQFNGTNLDNATNATLTLTQVRTNQAGTYTVVVRNASGSTPSRGALLTVLVPPPPSLVGLWRFDEGQGDQVSDSSGLGHRGLIVGENGNTPAWVTGHPGFGQALQYVNNGVDHAYVDVPASESLKIGLTANDTWTLAAWANEASDGAGSYVATYGRFLAQDGGLGLEWDSGAEGDSQFYLWHNSLTAWQRGFGLEAAVLPLLDQWTHWALVYDGQSLTLYRDANQGPLGARTSLAVRASLAFDGYAGAIQIGSQLNMNGTRNWNGMLDDVAIFTGALSESQVRTVMTGDFTAFLGPPTLSVTRDGGQVVVSWSSGVLQSTTDLPGGWQDQLEARSPLQVAPAGGHRFYRVRR